MEDANSVLSSCYWDAVSITSDGTIATEHYHTPTGSLMDISETTHSARGLTPSFHDMKISDTYPTEDTLPEPTDNENIEQECIMQLNNELSLTHSSIEKQRSVNEVSEPVTEPTPKKRSWKRDFWKRLSFTRSRIFQSFTIHKSNEESRSTKNIFRSLRHSIRRMRSFDKGTKLGKGVNKNLPKSASVVLGSDCDYFQFERDPASPGTLDTDDQRIYSCGDCYEGTPIKPRRQFTQEKYLTGSEEILQKAFNSIKRKSRLQDNKSLFDLCSAVPHVFVEELNEEPLLNNGNLKLHRFIDGCVKTFLDVHQKQIDNCLKMINKTIGDHIDLYSEDLDLISKSRKYQITELSGSKGVCVITNVANKKQFIALKRSCPKNWIFLTSFLQHTQNAVNIFPGQQWICFPAQSITNLYIEKNFFNSIHQEFKSILDALMQLIVILYCQKMNDLQMKINPFNVMLISSDLSIIFILIESGQDDIPVINDSEWLNLNDGQENDVRLTYQKSLERLNKYVDRFVSLPENMCHLITASYPLDYLFFLLLKLREDMVPRDNM